MAYYISMTREFYGHGRKGASTQVDLMDADTFGGVAVFASRAEAEARIKEFDSTIYYQTHNESGRAALRVKTQSQLTPPSGASRWPDVCR